MNILMHGRKTVANEEGFTSFTSDWEHILTSDKVLQHLYTIQACGHCGTGTVPLRWKSMEWFWNMHLLEWMFSPCWKKKMQHKVLGSFWCPMLNIINAVWWLVLRESIQIQGAILLTNECLKVSHTYMHRQPQREADEGWLWGGGRVRLPAVLAF